MKPDLLSFDQDTLNRIKAAKAAGVPDAKIIKEASEYQAKKMGGTSPTVQSSLTQDLGGGQGFVPKTSNLGNTLIDLLPLIGSVGGSFIPGLGTIVGGALGAGAGTLLKQGVKGDKLDLGEVGKETLLGGAGGVIGKGLGFLGGKLLGKAATGLEDVGQFVGTKALRLKPSQLAGFAAKHGGEDAVSFLAKEGALGKTAAEIAAEHINPLQESFNAVAKTSGLKVPENIFLKNVDDVAQELIQAGGSENAQLAEKIRREALYVYQNDLAPSNFDIGKLNKVRQTFASKVNWNDPEKAVVDYGLADSLRKSIIDTAEQSGVQNFQDIGIKLSKYRDLDKIITAQENLGRGSMPMGITKWLSLGAGAGLGGPVGGLAGLATNAIANSPSFLRGATGAALKGGETLGRLAETGIPSTLGTELLGRGTIQGGLRLPQLLNDQGDSSQNIDQTLASFNGNGASAGGTSQPNEQQLLREVIAQVLFSKAKSVSDIKAAYEFAYPEAGADKRTEQQVSRDEVGKLVQNAMTQLNGKGVQTGLIGGNVQQLLGTFGAADQGTLNFNTTIAALKAAIAKARAGTSFTPNEQKLLDQYTPTVGDSKQQLNTKLNLLNTLFASKGSQGSIPTPIGM